MAVSSKIYANFQLSLANKLVNLNSDTIKCMALTSSYTPNQGTHQFKSDLTNEISGTGYTATGVTVTVTAAIAGNVLTISSSNPSWTTATITIRYLVFYDATPSTDATRPLICYVDLGADVSSTGGTWTYTVPGTGIATFTVS